MTDLFPKTPKAIRERIRGYERALKQELQTGYGGDGYGKPKTIKKILDAMALPSQKPEPLAHSPPLFKDTTYVPL